MVGNVGESSLTSEERSYEDDTVTKTGYAKRKKVPVRVMSGKMRID